MKIYSRTDIGKKRSINQDAYYVGEFDDGSAFAIVCDGMGGHMAGDIASERAISVISDYIKKSYSPKMNSSAVENLLRAAVDSANTEIYDLAHSSSDFEGMGTTATLAIIYKNKLITAHVGDSRIYAVDSEGIKQVSTDHSFVQELLSRGEITREFAEHHPARNYITRAVGTEDTLKVDVSVNDYKGNVVLICSDGLTNMLSDSQIKDIVNENDDLQTAAEELVAFANKKGGLDNITVVAFCKE